MAKRRRRIVTKPAQSGTREEPTVKPPADAAGHDGASIHAARSRSVFDVDPLGIAAGLIAGLVVYVAYVPSDSVSVENGDALWVTFLALAIAAIVFAFVSCRTTTEIRIVDRLIDIFPWVIASWVMLGAFRLSPPGSLRMATSEAWLWVGGAAVFTAARRVFAVAAVRRCTLVLMISCAAGLAVHGLHQHFVSLPQNRMEYQRDPERVLQLAGIVAPAGSTERMVFENRLNDGGATATFALANSLAAVLIIGLVGSLGACRFAWSDRERKPQGVTSLLIVMGAALLCGGCLVATASRSAFVATLVGIAAIALLLRVGRTVVSLFVVAAGAVTISVAFATLGKSEWFQQAPASLSFRFQYWRSTMRMALENPWFGAGPGNFQSGYERFREDSAHEQIADPHNMLIETIASGGFVAAVFLILLALVVVAASGKVLRRRDNAVERSDSSKWIWLGSGLSLTMVWLLSFVTGVLPDIEAHLFAIPTAVAIAVFSWPAFKRIASRSLDVVASGCLIALSVHLMASGGWTVPGVAIYVWLLAAMLSRRVGRFGDDPMDSSRRGRTGSILMSAAMVALIGSVYFASIVPVRQSRSALAAANLARQRGDWHGIEEKIDEAIRRDPWSVEAKIQRADLLHWSIVLASPDQATRAKWETAIRAAKQTAGDNPNVYEILGQQQLHVYQRHGEPQDIRAALATFRDATRWSRASERLHAQLALIEEQLGDRVAARRTARRASELANSGGTYERILAKQLVAVARRIGKPAENHLSLDFAEILLQELLPRPETNE